MLDNIFLGMIYFFTASGSLNSVGSPEHMWSPLLTNTSWCHNGHWGRCHRKSCKFLLLGPSEGNSHRHCEISGHGEKEGLSGHDFQKGGSSVSGHCTWSLRNRLLAMCRMRSTWMTPPMLSTSTSATRPRTVKVSTSSCLYSGWGTWLRTDSTCTANLISPAVIYTEGRRTRPCRPVFSDG